MGQLFSSDPENSDLDIFNPALNTGSSNKDSSDSEKTNSTNIITTDYEWSPPWFGLESTNASFTNNTEDIIFPDRNLNKIIDLSFAVLVPFLGFGLVFLIGFIWIKIDNLLDYSAFENVGPASKSGQF